MEPQQVELDEDASHEVVPQQLSRTAPVDDAGQIITPLQTASTATDLGTSARLEGRFRVRRRQRLAKKRQARVQEWIAAHRAMASFLPVPTCDGPYCLQLDCPCSAARYLFVDHRAGTGWGSLEVEDHRLKALKWIMAALYYHSTGTAPTSKQVGEFQTLSRRGGTDQQSVVGVGAVSYTHLTLPTIYSV